MNKLYLLILGITLIGCAKSENTCKGVEWGEEYSIENDFYKGCKFKPHHLNSRGATGKIYCNDVLADSFVYVSCEKIIR